MIWNSINEVEGLKWSFLCFIKWPWLWEIVNNKKDLARSKFKFATACIQLTFYDAQISFDLISNAALAHFLE